MNCYYCKGVDTLEEQNTRFCVYDVPDPFVVEQVPALVCRLCGDKSFSGNVVKALEKSGLAKRKPMDSKVFESSTLSDSPRPKNPRETPASAQAPHYGRRK